MEDKKPRILLASPHMSAEGFEKEFVQEAFDTNWIAPLGKNVDCFESEMAEKLGAKATVALSAGTAAIHLALKLAGVEQDDVVFCSSLTFSASANPIVYEKAKPVFIDSEYETWNMSPVALERAFQKYEKMGIKVKAVVIVHLYGTCCKIEEIVKICHAHNCILIEDAAESLGTKYKGQYTGTFGDYGIISFNGNKIITTSGGGMLLCNTSDADEKAKKARFWATQSREAKRWYQHEEIGYNYRMSNICAGIGRGQLKVLDQRIDQKRAIYDYYQKELGQLNGLSLMPHMDEERSNCWLTTIQVADDCKLNSLDIMKALDEENIESRPVWKPLHLQPVFSKCDFITENEMKLEIVDPEMGSDNSVSGTIFRRGVCLPSDTKMTEADLQRICNVFKKLWES